MTAQEEENTAAAHKLLLAARDARIAQLERQRNFFACGVAVLIATVAILVATYVR
jgi:hypothetical protein